MTEPFAWFRYQQGSRVYYDTKKWDDCQPLYTQSASEYERGFIDGMQKQMQSSVDKAVNRMAQTQEPVAWMDADGNVSDNNDHKCFPIPLYTHPPQRTEQELVGTVKELFTNSAWDRLNVRGSTKVYLEKDNT
jgi:hypothetical protein